MSPMQLVILFSLLLVHTRAGTLGPAQPSCYYISPASQSGIACHQRPCITLSQFANNTTSYLSDNTTIIFLPGTYTLTSKIRIANVTSINLMAAERMGVEINCKQSGTINIFNTSSSYISGLLFITTIVKVGHLLMQTCKFVRTELATVIKSTIEIIESTVQIINSVLVSNATSHILSATHRMRQAPTYAGGAILITNSTLTILNCKFERNFANVGGAIFGSMGSRITINGSRFTGNHATSQKTNRANGGAIAVVGERSTFTELQVHDSIFRENVAEHHGGAIAVWNGATRVTVTKSKFIKNVAHYDGGALLLFDGVSAILNTSEFSENLANIYAGAMKIMKEAQANTTNCEFKENRAGNGGAVYMEDDASLVSSGDVYFKNSAVNGAVYVSQSKIFLEHGIFSGNSGTMLLFSSHLIAVSTIFVKNQKINSSNTILTSPTVYQEGGAITSYQSRIDFMGMCSMTDNSAMFGGGMLAYESTVLVDGDVIVSNNTATESGGGIYLYQSELNCRSRASLNVSSNYASLKGGGIHAIVSQIEVQPPFSSLHIEKNNSTKGGGICLEMNAKLYSSKAKQLLSIFNFKGNFAHFGGALYVTDETNFDTCGSTIVGAYTTPTECFIQIAKHTHYNSSQIIRFENNFATVSGSILYGGLLDRCKVEQFAQRGKLSGIDQLERYANLKNLSDVSSDPIRVCFCKNGTTKCNYKHPIIYVKKGENIRISLVAVDQVNHSINATIHSSIMSHLGELGEGQSIQDSLEICSELTFNVFSYHESDVMILYAQGPCKDTGISRREVEIQFLPCTCSIGFQETLGIKNKCECECDSRLRSFVSTCFSHNGTLLREGSFWITYITNLSDYLIYPYCPMDYCHSPRTKLFIDLSSNDGSDAQCNFNRSGILCGSCQSGYSLSLGSSRCIQCPGNWRSKLPALITGYLLAGVALVVLLFILNLTVATGALNGILLYANLIKGFSSTFLPFTRPNAITLYISWLNLESGVDFCLYEGMDTYWKTLIQLAFPSYVILLVRGVGRYEKVRGQSRSKGVSTWSKLSWGLWPQHI